MLKQQDRAGLRFEKNFMQHREAQCPATAQALRD
jgi:hypothetical protein